MNKRFMALSLSSLESLNLFFRLFVLEWYLIKIEPRPDSFLWGFNSNLPASIVIPATWESRGTPA